MKTIQRTKTLSFLLVAAALLVLAAASQAQYMMGGGGGGGSGAIEVLDATAGQTLQVRAISKTMSDGQNLTFWVYCSGGMMMGGGCRLPGPIFEIGVGQSADINLSLHMAPMESSPYQGHTIHLHGVDVSQAEDGVPVVSGINIDQARRSETLLCPHPAAVLLSHLVYPLRAYGPRRAVGTFLEPASTEGKQALDEVFEQTRAILSFSSDQPREIFSTQMAFNVIPGRRGEHVAGQVAALVGGEIEIYVQLLRCGVFHSFGASVHLTLTRDPGEEAVRKALAAHPGNDASPDPDLLGMIDAAGRDEVLIGPVEGVSGLPGTYRIWAVMDNLTCGAAVNALHILEAVSGAVMVN